MSVIPDSGRCEPEISGWYCDESRKKDETKGDVVVRQGQGRGVQVSKFRQVVSSAAGSPRPTKSLGHDDCGFSIFG